MRNTGVGFCLRTRSRSESIRQKTREPSFVAHTRVYSSMPKASAVIVALPCLNVFLCCHVFVSQAITSGLAAERRKVPVELNAKALTGAVCLFNVCTWLPVLRSQTLMVLSKLPEDNQRPSGLKASETIG